MRGERQMVALVAPVSPTCVTALRRAITPRRGLGQVRRLAEEAGPGRHGQKVRAQAVDLRDESGLGRGGEAKHRSELRAQLQGIVTSWSEAGKLLLITFDEAQGLPQLRQLDVKLR